jgi:predicted Zn-dependent peptidase
MRVAWDDTTSPGTSALGLFIDVGSRDERPNVWGTAHFLEHAVFKGAGTRNGRQIAEAGDRLGAEINAFTTRDYTCFYGKSMDGMLGEVYALIHSMVSEPWLTNDDVERERDVIAEEMREARDDTADRVSDAFMRALYEDDGLTHEVLGTPESVAQVSAKTLREFHRQFYVPARMALALAGEGGRTVIQQWVPSEATAERRSRKRPRVRPQRVIIEEDREQVQVILGVAAPPFESPESYACDLLATLLGGQTSSRLWQRLREDEGLVYSVDVDYEAEIDWAYMSISLAVHPSRLHRALAAIDEEVRRVSRDGFTSDEIERAKIQLRSGLWFGLETVDHRMLHLGRHLLLGKLPPSVATMEARIQAVQASELTQLLIRLWGDPSGVALAAVGPVADIGDCGLKTHLS